MDHGRVSVTPAIRAFLVRLDDLVDRHPFVGLDRDAVTTTTTGTAALVVLPHVRDHRRDVEIEIDDHRIVVVYRPERVTFTEPDDALRFVEMLGAGRVEIEVTRGPLWTTMRSYRDGEPVPFRRTRMPWPSVRLRTERRAVGFGS